MATRKKAKGKTRAKAKTKARKAPAKKPVARKKVTRKKPVRRAPPKPKKPVAAAPAVKPPPGPRIGVATHYFSHIAVAVVKLESGRLRVGDNIHFRGHTTDFAQRVDSLQVNHAPVTEVGPGDDFGLKVREHVRENDVVYKVT